MNSGIAYNVVAQFFLLTLYQMTKVSWFAVPAMIVTSCSAKI